jgi:hypothetical protein
MRHGELPRNSTTFFGAATGNSPFGKDFGLRKEYACNFNLTNYPEFLVARSVQSRISVSRVLPKKFFFPGDEN